MSGSRKNMWKLLYSIVNQEDTSLRYVFAYVDNILCQDPSLLGQSSEESVNQFQDTFILWLVKKLLEALKPQKSSTSNEDAAELQKANLDIQCKLLTSCLINRPVLFKYLITAYNSAIEQLLDGNTLTDSLHGTLLEPDNESSYIEITAFTSTNTCLKEIDDSFAFKPICLNSMQVDSYIQFILHILKHSLSVGLALQSDVMEKALLTVFKVFRDCQLITKCYALEYVIDLFNYSSDLNSRLQCFFEVSLRSLKLLYQQMPLWLNHEDGNISMNDLHYISELSIKLLTVLEDFHNQIENKNIIIHHVIHLMRNIFEMRGYEMRPNTSTVSTETIPIKNILLKLTHFLYPLLLNYPEASKGLNEIKFGATMKRIATIYPFLMRLMAPYVHYHSQNASADRLICIQYIFQQIQQFFTILIPNIDTGTYEIGQESLIALIQIEFLYIRKKQMIFFSNDYKSNTIEVQDENFNIDISNIFDNVPTVSVKNSIEKWIDNYLLTERNNKNNRTNKIWLNQLKIIGLILQSEYISNILSHKYCNILLQQIIQPLTCKYLYNDKLEDCELLMISLECIHYTVLHHRNIQNCQMKTAINMNVLINIAQELYTRNLDIHKDVKKIYIKILQKLIIIGWLPLDTITQSLSPLILKYNDLLIAFLKLKCCYNINYSNYVVIEELTNLSLTFQFYRIEFLCCKCLMNQEETEGSSTKSVKEEIKKYINNRITIVKVYKVKNQIEQQEDGNCFVLEKQLQTIVLQQLFSNNQLIFLLNHWKFCNFESIDYLQYLYSIKNVTKIDLSVFRSIIQKLQSQAPLDETQMLRISHYIFSGIVDSLKRKEDEAFQVKLLEMIMACTTNRNSSSLSDKFLFSFFKMFFFYLIHPASKVVPEAVLYVIEMCNYHGLKPMQLWNWYKRSALNQVIQLSIYVYLSTGVSLLKSLKAFSDMLGFSCVEDFICKYYRLLVSMLLPFCIKKPECKGLLVCISRVTQKTISQLFTASFLRIYAHVRLTEETAIGNGCIELVSKCTGRSLSSLMNTDVEQTVSEFLVYFHRSPQFVMQAFQFLLPNQSKSLNELDTKPSVSSNTNTNTNGNSLNKRTSNEFANFIADRFLGVITYFQSCLAEPNFERDLKEESMYSLGEIMRLIGPNHVTQLRYKIIAMLTYVLNMNDANLQKICLKTWKIFLHTINVEDLGPLMSRIVASLQPLLETYNEDINSICEYLILQNENLLGHYISDLYFLENNVNIHSNIRQCITRRISLLKNDRTSILEKLRFYHKHITNEHLQVRVYGLEYLRSFIVQHREEINSLILDVICVDGVLEEIVNDLVAGCRHEDRNLNLAAAKCLGELGAIDPSYLVDYTALVKFNPIALSIFTDEFARIALVELCRAYEFQKDTKYVDNFSLAIQETLSAFSIMPKANRKLHIWETIPKQMQQVIEPFLSSCYTITKREMKFTEHPLFNSSICNSYEEWSTIWTCRLIDLIQNKETNHLLNSYKPSIRRSNRLLTLFFPYILLHALFECKNDIVQYIYEEFQCVFNSFCIKKEINNDKEQNDINSNGSIQDSTNTMFINNNINTEQYNFKNNSKNQIWQTCIKHCSEQVDFLQRWLREWQRSHLTNGQINSTDECYKTIDQFVQKFDKLQMAKINYKAGEYVRSLVYLEEYICETDTTNNRLQEQISFLIKIHAKLSDSDSVQGAVYLKKTSLTLAEEILVNRLIDRPQDTITCYEQLLAGDEPLTHDNVQGIIDCYLRLDTPETALLLADGLWKKISVQNNITEDYFRECKSEILWRLGRYDELEDLLTINSISRHRSNNWSLQCAEACLLFRKSNKFDKFLIQLDEIRNNVVSNLRFSTPAGLERSYEHYYMETVRLHLLDEVEKSKRFYNNLIDLVGNNENNDNDSQMFDEEVCLQEVHNFFQNWDARMCVLQPTVRILEPVFACRRNLLLETQRLLQQQQEQFQQRQLTQKDIIKRIKSMINEEIGCLWLRSAQMYREAGCLQQAQLSLMNADHYKPSILFLEKSKLLWLKGEQSYTFKLLEENIERIETICSNDVQKLTNDQQSIYSEAKFLLASYNAESMNICSELNLRYFKEALVCNKSSEQCYMHLAQYMEKIYDSLNNEEKEGETGCILLLDIVINYAKSLRSSFVNVYQSLPRLLSIWLDFTAKVANSLKDRNNLNTDKRLAMQIERSRKMNDVIHHCQRLLPISIFYTAFSQLLSRLCHPSTDVYNNLKLIIIKLLENYPQQCLWMLLPVYKSGHTMRAKRCFLIFNDSKLNNSTFQKLLNDFNMLTERLIELTNKEVAFDSSYELSTLVKQLPRLFKDPEFSQIMLPFEKYMQAQFPMNKTNILNVSSFGQQQKSNSTNVVGNERNNSSSNTITPNVFPYTMIYIRQIGEEVIVIRSAAKPKKIVFECSDGIRYNVMVKPKDDLRKDFRLMEFNGLVKRYLHQDSEARHRRLTIRTYAAIPLNEECGLVEWLPNLNSFRNICMSIYRMRGLGIPDRIMRKYLLPKTDPIEKKRTVFTNILLSKHPAVFQHWFRQQFPTPHSWYLARSAYIKTVAVMSMVGYILGLGDRHGENILFDQSNADAVHVDFNCLFNLGETFPYPELVPFRLTHNMIAAMGPLGVEGPFRCCCEISLRVLKNATQTLVSVLTPFFYDLAFVKRNIGGQLSGTSTKSLASAQEVTDPKAILDVKRIENRLKGYVKKTIAGSIPLSVEGQVNFLIKEATDINNLAEMYIGWGAYI